MASSLVCQAEHGWVVNHEVHINSSLNGSSLHGDYWCLPELFDIHSPFLMDSQFQALKKRLQELDKCEGAEKHSSKVRRKKRKHNEVEDSCAEKFKEIEVIIQRAFEQLVALGRKLGHFREKSKELTDNNIAARKASSISGPGDRLAEVSRVDCCIDDSYSSGDKISSMNENFNQMIHHSGDKTEIIEVLGEEYLIPPDCCFLMSDVSSLQPLYNEGSKYDLIVIDPPWENKSVKRKKKYNMMKDVELETISMSAIAKPDALVVVWVTNNLSQHTFLLGDLFPKWGVQKIATWYWLKVTTSGELVCAMDGTHTKRPYESLIIGRYCPTPNAGGFPDKKVIVSVPCAIHSRKPPLREILEEHLPENVRCLEMFARNLCQGWTSWGNEVLKFQHKDFFHQKS